MNREKTLVLNGLIPLYKKLKMSDQTYGIFTYVRNTMEFDVFFDTGNIPFKIGFLRIKDSFQLWVNIEDGFTIDYNLDSNRSKKLKVYLGYSDNKKLYTKSFFKDFNTKISSTFSLLDREKLRDIVKSTYKFIEPEKIYFGGFKMYYKFKTNSRYKRQLENLDKTRLLYSDVYLKIKDKSISVSYLSKYAGKPIKSESKYGKELSRLAKSLDY